ncbi:MAG: 23S rRNA (pseudouridine(1915)-N(3))-methyltransferase RlmH [Acidobacteria bacterium]|nr:23S rRNA (pseudouridine(1915)-N(3))-methyltransferase RlmH [Acidobacteriota bacterium]
MYPVTFLVFGRPTLPGTEALEEHYRRLLRRHVRLELEVLPESRARDPGRALGEEAARLRGRLGPRLRPVLLDAGGESLDSVDFADWLGRRTSEGARLCFVLGSSHGFDPQLKAEAGRGLSLSPMTYPHDLARILFLEQLYRAFSILKGSPYHK